MRTSVRGAYDSSDGASTPAGLATGLVVGLVAGLRRAGVAVSSGETIDAVRALAELELTDRAVVRAALRSSLVKDDAHLELFERLFDALFPRLRITATGAGRRTADPAADAPAPDADGAELAALRTELAEALRRGDQIAVADLLTTSVDRWSGIGEQDRGERHHVQRVLRRLGLDAVLRQLADRTADRSELERQLDSAAAAADIEQVRRLLERLVAERLADGRAGEPGGNGAANGEPLPPAIAPDLADLPILRAGPDELAELRAAVRPLARKLATRFGRRRRRGRGAVDMRRTIRRSMSSGGVPLSPVLRRRYPSRPDLVVLCDVSGSVAQFAPFTLALLHALHGEFHRVRSWVFIDGIVEISDLLDRAPGVLDAHHLLGRRGLVSGDGRSDYARALAGFLTRWRDVISAKTTVIVVGDARSHDRRPAVAELAELHRLSRRLYWLNPEPRAEWDTGDSLMALYGTYAHGGYEVSTLRQLGECVAAIV
ncbi:MAG TPA: VWA domain-containing protein [Actinomycetes bacterium]|nr:VWA domain-containing protein [Actinomycetes bacterium]